MPVDLTQPADELSQGDLFDLVPLLYVKDLAYMVKIEDNHYRLESQPPPSLHPDRQHPANAVAVRRLAVVLTHDCEIEKTSERETLIVGAVRPMDGIPEQHKQGFRDNTRHRAFYLPASDYLADESYVDLRAVTAIRRPALEGCERLASMNDVGKELLQAQLFRFFARKLPPDNLGAWETED